MGADSPRARTVRIRVPATSANLGSGFDTVGLALDYHDEIVFTRSDDQADTGVKVIIEGEGEDTLPRDETHLVVSAFRKACQVFGLPRFGFLMTARNRIPQARGLGSSAEAIVAGISAAAAFAHPGGFSRDAVFDLAAQIEGHPDNVAPAVYGGLTVSYDLITDEGVGSLPIAGGAPLTPGFHSLRYQVDPAIRATVFVPDFRLSTQKARQALPDRVPYADAIHNLSRVALIPGALNPSGMADMGSGQFDGQGNLAAKTNALLFAATQDRLHQPYRAGLMPPATDLIGLFRRHGYAAAVSGAGPCVIVLHYGNASEDLKALAKGELASGHWQVLQLDVDRNGVQVECDEDGDLIGS